MVHHQVLMKLWMILSIMFTACNPKSAFAYPGHSERKLGENQSGFISIDCGASDDYQDEQTGIYYESDTKYVDSGEVHEISPNFALKYDYYQRQKLKLRSFPQGIRNCYTLRPKQGKNNSYMIRAVFVYANYDHKTQTPAFDLYLGVNKWVTVGDQPDLSYYLDTGMLLYEIIHAPLADYIDVCLINTGKGDPFISALELRPLENGAYEIGNSALMTVSRYDAGTKDTSKISRYPTDLYDRLWIGLDPYQDTISTSTIISNQSKNDLYNIPSQVLQTAEIATSANRSYGRVYDNYVLQADCFIYLHFAEIQSFPQNRTEVVMGIYRQRAVDIYLNGSLVVHSLKLEYLKPVTVNLTNKPTTCTGFIFDIYAVAGSNLPPILNAYELFTTLDLPLSPTNLDDVNAIIGVKQKYGVTKNWQGDPCLPRNYLWDGLTCSNETAPRITSLNLSTSQLSGEIAPSIPKLEKLESLDLSYNNITGLLPGSLGKLRYLRVLNLTGNKINGEIPSSLMEKVCKNTLQLSLDGKLMACERSNGIPVVTIVVSITAVTVFLILISLVIYKKRQQRVFIAAAILEPKKEFTEKSENQLFTYYQLVEATDNFKMAIGEGGFGKVYIGTLTNGTKVAVKMLSRLSKQGRKEFEAEVKLLMTVHHVNLVSLVGYCNERKWMALVYEYLENQDLKRHLSDKSFKVLSWDERLQIAIHAAYGLEYLHNGCNPSIIHRDLKTSNILLNKNLQAKIADFGLSRVSVNASDRIATTGLAGTPGYMDLELCVQGIYNKKTDVYSFGIILLELITGKSAMILCSGNVYQHIVQWINPLIQRGNIQKIVDPRLKREFNINSAWKILEIAMSCVNSASDRPNMCQVLAELKDCLVPDLPINNTLVYHTEMSPSSR